MNTRHLIAGAAVAASLAAGACIGHARMPADLATAPHAVAYVTVPSEVPTRTEAERWYYTHPGPSAAWRQASDAERAHARSEYLAHWEGGTEGCWADLRHAYQGTEADPSWVQPNLPVDTAAGSDLLLADYTDGVCGE